MLLYNVTRLDTGDTITYQAAIGGRTHAMDAIGFEQHDHSHCIATTVASVADQCASEGLSLTPVRRRVLEILLARHRALGAYDILDVLREEGFGSQPPVVYRALDFLTQNGFAHRIEGLNAFIACHHPGQRHAPAFLICRICKAVAEAPADPVRRAVTDTASQAGFAVERTVVEVEGVCPNCRDAA
jgi:Fur family zinc uptake transcriptional regulator